MLGVSNHIHKRTNIKLQHTVLTFQRARRQIALIRLLKMRHQLWSQLRHRGVVHLHNLGA